MRAFLFILFILFSVSAHAEGESSERKWRFGGGLYHSFADTLTFGEAQFNNMTYKSKYKLERAWGLQLEADYTAPRAWGVQVGLMIDGQRKIESMENSGAMTGSARFTNSAIDLRTLYVSAVYKWEHFYIPLGMNVTGGIISNPPVALSSVTGGVGAQLGFGWEFSPHVGIEALLRAMSLRGKSTNDGPNTYESRAGFMSGWQFSLKAYF